MVIAVMALGGCNGAEGPAGPAGADGAPGTQGEKGEPGEPGKDGAAAATSGARLRARWGVAEDGSRSFEGWQDSELGAPCTFALAADGKERCLPVAEGQGTIVYTGAECTGPAYLLWKGLCAPGAYHRRTYDFECGAVHVFEVGEVGPDLSAMPLSIVTYDGECVSYGPGSGYTPYVASEMDPASFVGRTVEVE